MLPSGLLTAVLPAMRERTVQHQVRDAFGVADGVLDRNGASLRDADQREAVDVCRFHHRFEVGYLRGQGQIGHVPVRETAATGVVADEPMSAREKAEPVTPHRALPIELEV